MENCQSVVEYYKNELNDISQTFPDTEKEQQRCCFECCTKLTNSIFAFMKKVLKFICKCIKCHHIIPVFYVLSTISIYLICIIGSLGFFYASFFIIFTIIMNGFCIMLLYKSHNWDPFAFVMWILGSSPYIDAIVFINCSAILIFLNYFKKEKKDALSLYNYGVNLTDKCKRDGCKVSFHLLIPIFFFLAFLVILTVLLLIARFELRSNLVVWSASILSFTLFVLAIIFLLILLPLPMLSKSNRKKMRNKFDSGIHQLSDIIKEENEKIKKQKNSILNLNDIQNEISISDSSEISSVEEYSIDIYDTNLNNETLNFEDFYINKNEYKIDHFKNNEISHLMTCPKLLRFFSIGSWNSYYINQWNFYFNKKEYGKSYSCSDPKNWIKHLFFDLSILLQLVRIAYDGAFVFKNGLYKKIDIVFYVIRSLFRFVTIIFIAFNNVIGFLIDIKKIKRRYPDIFISKIISIITMILMTGLLIASHIFSKQILERDMIQSFDYNSSKIINNIDVTEKASICSINIRNFSIIEMAGLTMISTITNEELRYNLTKQIFNENIIMRNLNGSIISGILVKKNNNYAVAYSGLWKKSHIGILVESIGFKFYSNIVSKVVPFFEYFDKIRKNIIWFKSLPWIYSILLIGKDVTKIFTNDLLYHLNEINKENITNPVFIGQMIGGLASKFSEVKWDSDVHSWSVAFESPSLKDTKIEHFAINDKSDMHNPLRMINIYSGSSVFSFYDESATFNFNMPKYQSYFKPATSYETFCVIAAGCTETDRYDDICKDLNSNKYDKYANYFKKWKRTRMWK